jgi:hypothetical protein
MNLDDLLSQGSNLFDLLDNQLLQLQQQLSSSETTITALQLSLSKAGEIIGNLKKSLTGATNWANRMGERLQENNEDIARAYEQLDAADAYAIKLQKKANRSGPVSISFGLIGGAGLAWGATDAIYSQNSMKAVYGACAGLVTFGLWAIGHWTFDWW